MRRALTLALSLFMVFGASASFAQMDRRAALDVDATSTAAITFTNRSAAVEEFLATVITVKAAAANANDIHFWCFSDTDTGSAATTADIPVPAGEAITITFDASKMSGKGFAECRFISASAADQVVILIARP